MRHAVAFTHGYGVVVKGVEVNRHAERSADFVLTAVTFADACAFVVRAGKMLLQEGILTTDEMPGAKKVLSAAALTYLASLMTSLVYFLRFFLYVLTLFGRRNDRM